MKFKRIFFCFVFNSECRGENCVPFSSTEDTSNSPGRQFEYRFFSCHIGNLQVDVILFCFVLFHFGKGCLNTARSSTGHFLSFAKVNPCSGIRGNSKRLDTALCEV